MSFVNLIVVKDESIFFGKIHYNALPRINLEEFTKEYLDAGFVIIDHNNKTIIDAQDAFPIEKLQFKDFLVYSLTR